MLSNQSVKALMISAIGRIQAGGYAAIQSMLWRSHRQRKVKASAASQSSSPLSTRRASTGARAILAAVMAGASPRPPAAAIASQDLQRRGRLQRAELPALRIGDGEGGHPCRQ